MLKGPESSSSSSFNDNLFFIQLQFSTPPDLFQEDTGGTHGFWKGLMPLPFCLTCHLHQKQNSVHFVLGNNQPIKNSLRSLRAASASSTVLFRILLGLSKLFLFCTSSSPRPLCPHFSYNYQFLQGNFVLNLSLFNFPKQNLECCFKSLPSYQE